MYEKGGNAQGLSAWPERIVGVHIELPFYGMENQSVRIRLKGLYQNSKTRTVLLNHEIPTSHESLTGAQYLILQKKKEKTFSICTLVSSFYRFPSHTCRKLHNMHGAHNNFSMFGTWQFGRTHIMITCSSAYLERTNPPKAVCIPGKHKQTRP
jgi:hypothetical protein